MKHWIAKRQLLRRISAMIVLSSLINCKGCQRELEIQQASQSDWIDWFGKNRNILPKWEGPTEEIAGTLTETPDHLALILPTKYKLRNKYGCWDSSANSGSNIVFRSVCISRMKPDDWSKPGFFFGPAGLVSSADPERRYEEWRAGFIKLAGRDAIAERFVTNGGFEGANNRQDVRILIELKKGTWAIFEGEASDTGGFEEFLQIGKTITLKAENAL